MSSFLEVDLQRIFDNLLAIHSFAKKRFILVLKNDAYGVGLKTLMPLLEKLRTYGFLWAVAIRDIEEGIRFRELSKGTLSDLPLIALMPEPYQEMWTSAPAYNVQPVIYSEEALSYFSYLLPPGYPVHLKLETGMNRFGVSWEEIETFLERRGALLQRLKVRTVFTHLVDGENPELTEEQIARFWRAYHQIVGFLGYKPLTHLHSSSAILFNFHSGKSFEPFHLLRFGILTYGIAPSLSLREIKRGLKIASAITLKVKPLMYRRVKSGDHIGYGSHLRVPSGVERIAILPIGYNEIPRNISPYLRFKVSSGERELYLRMLGNICMDCSFLEYPPDLEEGLTLTAFEEGDWEEIAEKMGTVPHELLLKVSLSLEKRVSVEEPILRGA